MKTLNELILDYTSHVRQGDLQTAYKGILDYMGRLRREFVAMYQDYEVGNSIYQGYMDMSYFSINTAQLNEKGLKIAIVYLHAKGTFEIWLSARNREIGKKYKTVFDDELMTKLAFFHDSDNADSIIEYTLMSDPDFDDQNGMSEGIIKGTEKFISAVLERL